MEIIPIGTVKDRPDGNKEIRVYDEFSEGLKGVENRGHLWVLFWMNKLSEKDREILLVHPRGNRAREKQGVFALHSPMRPNPIGMTRVRLIERTGNTLIVEGLDAFDDTPVIDIKSG